MENVIQEFLSIGSGSGSGDGSGSGSGSGYGDGYGSGDGSGYGSGDGYGSGVTVFNGHPVYQIDGLATLIYRVRGNLAKGAVLGSDLTLTPCWIAKVEDCFAHGETPHEAQGAAQDKAFELAPIETRIQAFYEAHKAGQHYPNTDFFAWHHRLTGSCLAGRKQFAREHGIDVESGQMTPEEFICLTESAYGGKIIRGLRPLYGMDGAGG